MIGPIIGCIAIQWLSALLGGNQSGGGSSWLALLSNPPLVLGAILIAFVLLIPKGIVPTLSEWGLSLAALPRSQAARQPPRRACGARAMSAPLLETRDLGINFGGVRAVRDVNFTLAEKELRCLIGPNGAGKSTFFKLVTGQLPPSHGAVLFRGQDISHAQAHTIARLGIGIKTQVPSVFDGLSVRENIWLSAIRLHSKRRAEQIVDEMLERVGLTASAKRLVGQLAHGQRQWVELGIVLSTEPTLVLLDEPAAGMTHEEVMKTADLVREINRDRALIVVEHDMQFIKMIASKVTVFNQGAVMVEDSVENIMRNPQVRDVYLGKQAAA